MSEAEKKIEEEYPFQALREAAKFGYQLAQEEYKKQLKHEMEGIYSVLIGNGKIEPNQDELWEEMFRVDEEEGTQEVKKRYRITRI